MLKSDLKNNIMFYNKEYDLYFEFNGSQTINVYCNNKNIDCMTIGTSEDYCSIEKALKTIDAYLDNINE